MQTLEEMKAEKWEECPEIIKYLIMTGKSMIPTTLIDFYKGLHEEYSFLLSMIILIIGLSTWAFIYIAGNCNS